MARRSRRARGRDTGVGIPAAELPRIFERFHRVEGTRGAHARGHRHRARAGPRAGAAARRHGRGRRAARAAARRSPSRSRAARRTCRPSASRAARRLDADRRRRDAVRRGSAALAARRTTRASRAAVDATPRRRRRPRARVLVADDNADMRDYVARLLGAALRRRDGRATARRRSSASRRDAARPGAHRRDDAGARRLRPAARRCAPTRARAVVPVILLSARAGEERAVEGLDAGRRRLPGQAVLRARAAWRACASQLRRMAAPCGAARERGAARQPNPSVSCARPTARKDEFLAMLAHELRNPLAPIRNGARADPAGRRRAGRPSAACAAMIERQVAPHGAAGRRPARRVAHHAGQDRAAARSRVELAELVHERRRGAARRSSSSARHRRSRSTLPPTAVRTWTPTRRASSQVSSNLLHNAVKYTPRGRPRSASRPVEPARPRLRRLIAVTRQRRRHPGRACSPRVFDLFTQGDRSRSTARRAAWASGWRSRAA